MQGTWQAQNILSPALCFRPLGEIIEAYCEVTSPVCILSSHIAETTKGTAGAHYKRKLSSSETIIPFSAFWLRSSVVSVLISLISDTWANGSHDIKFIYLGWGSITVACSWGSQASPLPCTIALVWRTPPTQEPKALISSVCEVSMLRCILDKHFKWECIKIN